MIAQDILRPSVTPRATLVSDRIAEAIASLPYLDVDRETTERREQLKEWQFVISMTIAWGQDISASELAEWQERLS